MNNNNSKFSQKLTGGQAVVQSLKKEKAYQKDFFGKRYIGSDISSPPFDKVAELYGAKGFKVEKVSEINEAVKAAINSNSPSVIDVAVDPKALYSFRRDTFKKE